MSLRSFFKNFLPDPHQFRNHKHLRHFGSLLHDPGVWHLSRRSTAGGIAVGLFCAYIPLPIHMIVAAATAIFFRVNLPLAVLVTWITNPLTFAPIFYFAYQLGSWLLREPVQKISIEFSLHWLQDIFVHIWQPLLLGCIILATVSALIGYFTTSLLWRFMLVRKRSIRTSRRS